MPERNHGLTNGLFFHILCRRWKNSKFITGFIIIAFLSTVIIIVKRIPHKGKETPNIFKEFLPFETESETFVISRVTKIDFSDGKIFIFDQRQKKIFVFSESLALFANLTINGNTSNYPCRLEKKSKDYISGMAIFIS